MNRRGMWTIVGIFAGLFVVFFGFSVVMLSMAGGSDALTDSEKAVGVVEISGAIMASKKTIETIDKFASDEMIKAIVIRVDSPGGAVAPSQEIYQAVVRARAKKPLVVSMGSTAASGGYYIAIGSETIYANSGTITGSIGVITQMFNVERLLDKANIEVNAITSGRFKDSGSPYKALDEKERAYFQAMVNDIYEQFIEDVAAARKLDLEKVKEVADGRVFTGRQAKKLGLVDELGTLHDAAMFVAKKAEIEGEPDLVYPKTEQLGFLSAALRGSVRGLVQEAKNAATPAVEYRFAAP